MSDTEDIFIKPTHECADAFWQYWEENGETHKHGYYESTWGAINAAIHSSGIVSRESAHKAEIDALNEKHSLEYKESMELMQKNFDETQDLLLKRHKAEINKEVMKVLDRALNSVARLRGIDRYCEGWNGCAKEVEKIISQIKQEHE